MPQLRKTAPAPVNPTLLIWSRERVGLSPEALARKLHVKPEKIHAWEQGQEKPTMRQARMWAQACYVPLGYLFLAKPPETRLPLADFRGLPDEQGPFSPELEDVIQDALRKRDWLRERRLAEGWPPLAFIGKFSWERRPPPEAVAKDIRTTLSITPPPEPSERAPHAYLASLVKQAEALGILVLQSSYVGTYTRRVLDINEFRGFALSDPYAPLIFINAKDTHRGRIFTLMHEMAHLWIGTSGVSNPDLRRIARSEPEIERFCNQVAAEVLVPAEALRRHWPSPATYEALYHIARQFGVSMFVILLRGRTLGLLPRDKFQAFYDEAVRRAENQDSSSGGHYYNTFVVRNSRTLLHEIAYALQAGLVGEDYAARLLNTTPRTLYKALERLDLWPTDAATPISEHA